MKKKAWLILSSVFLLSVLLSPCACSKKEEMSVPELIDPVDPPAYLWTVQKGDIQNVEVYPGKIAPDFVSIRYAMDGTVGDCYRVTGDHVSKGDPILSLDISGAKDKIREIDEEIEEIAYIGEREDLLHDIAIRRLEIEKSYNTDWNSINQLNLSIEEESIRKERDAESRNRRTEELETRRAELEEDIKNMMITAPCSGYVVLDEAAFSGNWVVSGGLAGYVLDEEHLLFSVSSYGGSEISLKQYEFYGLFGGKKASLQLEPLREDQIEDYQEAGKNPAKRFKILQAENKAEIMKEGTQGDLVLEKNVLRDVLIIPKNALKYDSDGSYVYLPENGFRVRRNVKTGISDGAFTEVLSGLSEGEEIYVEN